MTQDREDDGRAWVWTWSVDPESWPVGDREYGTREEAIAAGRVGDALDDGLAPGGAFWVSRWRRARISDFFRRERDVCEWLAEDAGEDCGECVGDWMQCWGKGAMVSVEAAEDLGVRIKAALEAWADAWGLQPRFGPVRGVEKIEAEG